MVGVDWSIGNVVVNASNGGVGNDTSLGVVGVDTS